MAADDRTLAQLFEEGLAARRAVLGADYVDASLAAATPFNEPFQHMTTEWCWGYAWGGAALDRRARSLMNLAMLTALGKPAELKLHVKGALANGLTVEEIREALLHATVYCGIPAGLEAFRAAAAALEEAGAPTPQPRA
jgi:4-carboxymuconolactone decarboxylase